MRTIFLRTVLHLHANQMRTLMIRPFLYSSFSSVTQPGKYLTAMEVAGDTVQTIADLHARSDVYRRQQAFFNHFLISALGLLYVLIIRDTVKGPLHSVSGDRLSPHALAKAYSRLFCGLDILESLGASTTSPRSLSNKLFPIISRLKVLQIQNEYPGKSTDYSTETLLRFPTAYTQNTSSQSRNHNPTIDPELTTTKSSSLNITSQSITQALPGFGCDIMNMFEQGEAYTEDDIHRNTAFDYDFLPPSNENTLSALFSGFQAPYFRLGTMDWQNL